MKEKTVITQLYEKWLVRDLNRQDFLIAIEEEKEQMINFADYMPMKKGVTQEGRSYCQYDAEQYYKDLFE